MAHLPHFTPEQIENAIPDVSNVERVGAGGQKVVYRATIQKETYALKLAMVPESESGDEEDDESSTIEVVSARAKREIETMRECASKHMVKLGPIGLNFAEIEGQRVLYFTEEFIVGEDLQRFIRSGPLSHGEVVKLGLHIGGAIKSLWDLGKVHRDIKPGNIMRRENEEYVLLDAGLAFDVTGDSFSVGPVGTLNYFSPEQFDFSNRRTGLDFRSDMFSLGVTMYIAATGTHPFVGRDMRSSEVVAAILQQDPEPPSKVLDDNAFPEELDDVILQMIGKSPHLRYRTCDRLIEALEKVK